MAEQPHTSLRLPCAMPSVGLSGVKLIAIGLWSSGITGCIETLVVGRSRPRCSVVGVYLSFIDDTEKTTNTKCTVL
jgi:hypothetical protein